MIQPLRIAVLAHSHPVLTKGGGEVVAHRSFAHLRQICDDASLFAVAPPEVAGSRSIFASDERIVEYANNEFLLNCQKYDGFLGINGDYQLLDDVASLCKEKEVNVFHFHHFFRVGLNTASYLRDRFPDAAFVLTLHEYLSICYMHGQMLKRNSRHLCERASPVDCHLCFPEHSKEEFSLRASLFNQLFESFHVVTSPSKFLAQRIEQAGLTPAVQIVRNGTSQLTRAHAGTGPASDIRRKFAFFGRANPYKGLDIYLRAAVAFLEKHGAVSTFAVFGCDAALAAALPECNGLVSALSKWSSNLHFRGPYDPSDAVDLMHTFGWIVVPSIWWENSPIVIQEAFLAGRPVICSGIGGMKEAVIDQRDGLHFRPNDWADLTEKLERCIFEENLWANLQQSVEPPVTIEKMNSDFVGIYKNILQVSNM